MLKTIHKSLRLSICMQTLRYSCADVKTVNAPLPRGKLMIIPTPIGNLGDLSPHIVQALFTADLIGCEDRRVAGQLYHLIRGRKILTEMEERFGNLGLTGLVEVDQEAIHHQEKAHQFYNYANMKDSQRRKFLRKMTEQQQAQFRVQFLKYRAKKILDKDNEWIYHSNPDRFDQLYGIDVSDLKHIETQILNCRKKKGRGVLIPLNTYSETKMFNMVKALLESKKVALVSDAGMPCISDPGWKLVDKIRTSMPSVPIEVIGGPSSVSILAAQASVCSKGNSLSGRFQGFSSLSTGNFQEKHRDLQAIKMKQFSIHFINANKLKGRLLQLQRMFGGQHKIIINNELTKKYQRRFQGTISEVLDQIDQPDFKPVGQISYLLYPTLQQQQDQTFPSQQNELQEESKEEQSDIDLNQTVRIDIPHFLKILEAHQPKMPSKQKIKILCDIFGIKTGLARKYIYDKFSNQN